MDACSQLVIKRFGLILYSCLFFWSGSSLKYDNLPHVRHLILLIYATHKITMLFKQPWHYKYGYSKVESIFFYKGIERKYFRLCELHDLCSNYSVLLLQPESSHRQYINRWSWLYSSKTLFTKQTVDQNGPPGCSLPTPILERCTQQNYLWPWKCSISALSNKVATRHVAIGPLKCG